MRTVEVPDVRTGPPRNPRHKICPRTVPTWSMPSFLIRSRGRRRASPKIDSTWSSFSRERKTLVPTFPVAPITTTRMARSLPARSTGVTPRVAAKARLPTEWRLTCTLGNSCRPLQESLKEHRRRLRKTYLSSTRANSPPRGARSPQCPEPISHLFVSHPGVASADDSLRPVGHL
jgi:hypothetical protein